MGDRPTDRPAVADLHVADVRDRLDGDLQGGRVEDLGVRRERPDLQAAVGLRPDALELVEAADVHEGLGAREAQLHQRQQALAAGDDLGPAAGRRDRG